MDVNIKNDINIYIKLLSSMLESKTNNKLKQTEYKEWIPNCVECLEFALNNEQLLENRPSLYIDTLTTLSLLCDWIFEEKLEMYTILYHRFRKVYTAEECGEYLKLLSNEINKYPSDKNKNSFN